MEQAPEPGQHQRGLLGQAEGQKGPGQVQQCRGALHPEVLQEGGAVKEGDVQRRVQRRADQEDLEASEQQPQEAREEVQEEHHVLQQHELRAQQ